MTEAQSPYKVEPLRRGHDRVAFTCGVEALDLYIRQQAQQDVDRKLAAVFVLTSGKDVIAGFYTLSAHALEVSALPEHLRKKLPRLPAPATLLGRMAVSKDLQGQGLGEFLLMHALERAWLGSQEVGSWAVVVDAKAGARDFYLKHDFLPLPSQPSRLFLPMKAIGALFG